MVSYAAGAYYAIMEGVRAMLQYEGYIKEELTKTFPDPISELILGYYDIHAEYSYCVGHTKMENDERK